MQPPSQDYYEGVAKVWENERDVLQQMNSLNEPKIVQFLTAFARGDPGSQKHYLMFEYATGGNLRQLWKTVLRPKLTPQLVYDAVHQLQGLADALQAAHDPTIGQLRFRHGDLKPENILWFKDASSTGDSGLGTLKIADWGLAKQHETLTEFRKANTTTPTGTRLYEPPEEITWKFVNRDTLSPEKPIKRRSRLCDIWAMGCITLEFLIWLMYGSRGVDAFARSLGAFDEGNYARFYQIFEKEGQRTAKVHEVVLHWMDHMADDPACKGEETALGDLLDMVRTRLLVVKLPQRYATMLNHKATNASATKLPSGQQLSDQIMPGMKTGEHLTTDSAIENSGPEFQLVVDPAPSQPSSSTKAPHETEPRPVIKSSHAGMDRALASGFQDHMLLISGDEHEDSYWLTRQPGLPPNDAIQSDPGERTVAGVQREKSLLFPEFGMDVTKLLVTGIKSVRIPFLSDACSELC